MMLVLGDPVEWMLGFSIGSNYLGSSLNNYLICWLLGVMCYFWVVPSSLQFVPFFPLIYVILYA